MDDSTRERARHMIKLARKRKGWDQKEAAKRLGIPDRTYWTYEHMKPDDPSPETIEAIARGLEIPELVPLVYGQAVASIERQTEQGGSIAPLLKTGETMTLSFTAQGQPIVEMEFRLVAVSLGKASIDANIEGARNGKKGSVG